jgi:hypothetical protein
MTLVNYVCPFKFSVIDFQNKTPVEVTSISHDTKVTHLLLPCMWFDMFPASENQSYKPLAIDQMVCLEGSKAPLQCSSHFSYYRITTGN